MRHINPDNLIVIDIETVSENRSFDSLKKEWQLLWEEKTSRTLPEGISAADFYPERAGVMAEFAKIICISIGYFNKDANLHMRIKSVYGHDEKKLLEDFIATIDKIKNYNNNWCFAGHNIKEFDIPFICRRLLINNIPLPPYLEFHNKKPWETNIVDTFQYWRFGDYKNFTSLNLLASAMKVPSSKDDIDGSMVGKLYWSGDDREREINLKRIVAYCQKDIITTANIILRFKNIEIFKLEDITVVE